MELDEHRSRIGWLIPACWLLLLFAAIVAYAPGLAGPFLFDDFAEISKLGRHGGIVDWESFRSYVLGGTAGPSGRPVSLLSFLLDGRTWPADPYSFKRTNLVIHLLCGTTLAVVTRQILGLLGYGKEKAAWIALGAAGCWLLHPFLVSTTLYAVQRMAQLASLFVLAGLAAYLYGRCIAENDRVRGYLIMSLSLVVFTTLATLSKENGAVLPTLVGVFEITVALRSGLLPLDRKWASIFLLLPTLAIGLLLAYKAFSTGLFEQLVPRDFSLYERLLTQPRVLSEYVMHWYIPKLYTTGVFQDHIVPSRGLLVPPATLLHMAAHVGLIIAALAYRLKYPLISFAVLFYYGGHLVESTTLNLELYFEHRNYLPAAFLLVPPIAGIVSVLGRNSVPVIVLGMLVLAGFTRYSATVWADYDSIVEASAQKAPMSVRAQAEYAKLFFNADRYEDALTVIDRAIDRHADAKPQLELNRLVMLCKLSLLDDPELRQVAAALSSVPYDGRLLSFYEEFALAVMAGDCPRTTLDGVHAMFQILLDAPTSNRAMGTQQSQVQYFLGLIDSRNDNVGRAVEEFESSLSARPSVSAALNIAAVLATGGHYAESLTFVERARELGRAGTHTSDGSKAFDESDIDGLERTIRDEMSAGQP
jgi:tetratricopeptide (TPR) repeat protein